MKHRFHENDEVVTVDAADTSFRARLAGNTAHGDVFIPHCIADRGDKLRLRIQLGDQTFKADGRVAQSRGYGPVPGCDVTWYATKPKSVDVVNRWLEGRRVTR